MKNTSRRDNKLGVENESSFNHHIKNHHDSACSMDVMIDFVIRNHLNGQRKLMVVCKLLQENRLQPIPRSSMINGPNPIDT